MSPHRAALLPDVRADVLSTLRRAGLDVPALPPDLDAALEDLVATAPLEGDPEAEAAHRADVRAWAADRLPAHRSPR